MKRLYTFFVAVLLIGTQAFSQTISSGYTVATWEGFRTSAATFTFDDGCANQLSLAVPVFDKFGYKASFYLVTSGSPNWSTYSNLVTKGYEVGSHSVNHGNPMPDNEISTSKQTINSNITNQDCNTITYPNCTVPSETELAKYYIGGRICDGNINSKSPSNYYRIGSIICGSQGACATTDNFKTQLNAAINNQGWAVFLIHEVESGTGYSPTATSAIEGALQYASDNDSKIWVTTFRNAIMYAKERDNLSLVETSVSSTQLSLVASTTLSSSIVTYNYPITVRRQIPSGWTNVAVSLNSTDIAVTIETINSVKYAQFSVIPGKTYTLEDRQSTATVGGGTTTTTTTNSLLNGEFDDGTTSWSVQNNNSTASTFSISTSAGMSGTNAAQVCPSSSNYGTAGWHIQLYQNVTLEAGKQYTLTFSAKAASARTMGLMIQQLADPYTSYLATSYNLTTTVQTFTETFTAPTDVDAASKLTFCVGGDPNCVYIDNVFFGTETTTTGGGSTGGTVEVTSDISQYFIDKAYIGPSCDGTPNTRGAYYTGVYPNLFTQYLGKTQAEVDAKINSVWTHFFDGGSNTVYYQVAPDMAYIYDTGNGDVRTEGMSYGMMICVQLGKQDQFDRLWRWAKKYMQYKSGDAREGLFAWQCATDGTIKGASCAPDGEAYFLTALFFASHRWGNTGTINYEEEAQYLIKQILNKPGRAAGTVSPIFNMTNNLITFGETSYGFTDPSYNLPGFFELWAKWTNTNATFWANTPTAARNLLYKSSNTTTGLYPDYSNFDGSGYYPSWAGYATDTYKYDAIRCPMNVGMDYNWFAADTRQQTMVKNILTFFKNDGYAHGYFNLDGSNASGSYSEGMAGANGVGVFALPSGNDALAKEYVQKLWNTTAPSGTWRYYNGMVYFLSMLHASGNFKIFKPTPEVVTQTLSGPAPVEFNGESFSKDTAFKTLIDCKIYDVTITIEQTTSHTVIFKDYDGTQLSTAQVVDGAAATAPTSPSRIGYTFSGWDKTFTNVTADLTITAQYTINSYKVTFVDYNGTELKSQNVDYGSAATAPTSPSRIGYTFSGWDKTFTNITAAITITAQYTINSYKVSFVDYNGTELKAQNVNYGSAATAPTSPSRTGYTFSGWDKTFTNITSNLTVTAQYTQDAPVSTKYEAENAVGSSTNTVSLAGASNGKYVQMQDGSITFTVNASDGAGTYKINIVFSQTYGDSKAQNIQVNGASAGSVTFVKTGSSVTFSSVEVVLSLNSGSNTIAITKSWGWVDIDYIEVTKNQIEKFAIDENLVTPNPANGTQEVYDFLRENFGSKVVSGVMTLDVMDASSQTYNLKNQTEVAYIHSASGKYPALVGFDFMHSTGLNSTNDWQKAYTNSAIAMAKELWKSGGIPEFTWHWRNPNQNDDSFYTSSTLFNLANAFTNSSYTTWNTSSTEYKNIIADIDKIAGYLEQLRCAGVSILWRPIHEASGGWFWWGAKGSTAYKQLYKLMFDRLVNYHGLNNLIWVWNSDGTDSDWYPGANYVDIVGRDYYYSPREINHASLVSEYVAVAEVTNYNKIVSLAECGSVPYPTNMLNDGARWSYFMPWYGDYVTSDNTTSDWNTIMNSDLVISLDEMSGWDGRTKLYDTVSLGNSYTKNDFSVTPTVVGDSENEKTFADQNGCDSVVVLFLHTKAAEIVTYTVTFVDGYTTSTIETQTIESGQSATAPSAPVHANYTFSGWDKTFTSVTSNLTVIAQYTENAKANYTALNAAISQAEALTETDYTAATWSAMQTALTTAKAVDKNLYVENQNTVDAATTALTSAMNALVKVYTVTFVDYNGTTIQSVKVESGQSATAPAIPTRTGYTFSGWDKTFTSVTSNMTVTAQYTENAKANYTALNAAISQAEALTETDYTAATWSAMQTALTAANSVDKNLYAESQSTVDAATTALTSAMSALVKVYTVTFVDGYTATTIETQTIESGQSATAPSVPVHENYTFSGWDKTFTSVTSNLTVTAQYTENAKASYVALNAAIAQADALTETDYTATTWSAMQTALTIANSVDKNLYVESQSTIDVATTALTSAINALVKVYTVTFVDYNGTTIQSVKVESGQSATAPAQPSRDGYTFSGWDKTFTNVTSNLTVTAQYVENGKADYNALNAAITQAEALTETDYTATTWSAMQTALTAAKAVDKNLYVESQSTVDVAATALTSAMSALVKVYTVTFVDYNGTTIQSVKVESGHSATAPAQPSRDGYTFSGWDKTFTSVTSNLTVTAQYTENAKASYVALNAAIAQADALTETDYTATTWSAMQTALTAANSVDKNLYVESQSTIDVATTALTSAINALVKVYTVTFVDYNGTTIQSMKVESGQSATAPAQPSRDGYTFSGWDKAFSNVTSNLTITAQYTAKGGADYTALNAAISQADALIETDYTATTWSAMQTALTAAKAVDKSLYVESQSTVDAAATALTSAMNALVKVYTVTFVDYNGTTIQSAKVASGQSATAPAQPSRDGYTFSGWDKAFSNVTSNLTITAQYTAKGGADYTALNAAISQADALTETDYTATTWSTVQTALTAAKSVDKNLYAENQSTVDAATTALTSAMNALVKVYTVTFVDYNGTTIQSVKVTSGQSATAPAQPSRDGYTFSGWDKTFTSVTSNLTITAQYTAKGGGYTALNAAISQADALTETDYTATTWSTVQTALTAAKAVDKNLYAESQSTVDAAATALTSAMNALVKVYTVTFVDYNGTTIQSAKVASGQSATAPAQPSRDGYTFSGWDKAFSNVTSNLTITAQYTAKGGADYTALNAAISQAEALAETDFTAATWSTVQTALSAAKSVDKNLYVESQSSVDNATAALTNAIANLVNVNRTILAATISTAESTVSTASIGNNKGQYPIDAKTALNAAIQTAKNVYNKVSVSQSEIDAANAALISAIDTFKASIITVDKNELLIALGQAHTAITRADGNTGTGSGQYPESAVTTLQTAIDNAQQIYNTAREQLVVDAETITLRNAIQAFLQSVNPVVIDYSELTVLVAEASDLLNTTNPGENPGQYSLLAYMDLWLAKQTAEEIVANQSASTQEDVDLQETIVREAIDAYRSSIILATQSVDSEAVSIYTKGYNVVIENAENQGITVYDITGRAVATVAGSEVSDYTEVPLTKCGVYIVKCGMAITRVLIQ